MHIDQIRNYCLSLKGVTEHLPFGPDTLTFKVMDKMFCLVNIEKNEFVNLKCDPEEAQELREQYSEVQPGYHMSKKHWNSVYYNQSLSDEFIIELINHSYQIVVLGLTKKLQQQLKEM